MMRTKIRGERVVLKAYEESFIPLLYEAATEARDDEEFTRWLPWCHADYSIADSRAFVEKTLENWRDSENVWREGVQFGYAVFDRETNRFLGGVGLYQANNTHKILNLGYWTRPSAQKGGIASEAARLVSRAAFEDLPDLARIEIVVGTENVASRRAAEKSGAHFEGILRRRLLIAGTPHDAAMFSFVRADFEENEK